jgi:uncharacterized iron-regulated protein
VKFIAKSPKDGDKKRKPKRNPHGKTVRSIEDSPQKQTQNRKLHKMSAFSENNLFNIALGISQTRDRRKVENNTRPD